MIETRIYCDCCGERIGTPYVTLSEGYFEKDQKNRHYCVDCGRVLLEAWRDAVRERKDYLGE